MAATAVLAGTVEVVVTKIPPHRFLAGFWCSTRRIERADFVGMTVDDAVRRVEKMMGLSCMSIPFTLNGRALTAGDESSETTLKADDKLELVYL